MKNGRRASRTLTIGGRTRFLVDWALDAEIDPKIVRARIAAGWEAERAIATPQTYFPKRYRRNKRRRLLSLPLPIPQPAAAPCAHFRPRVGGFRRYPLEALEMLRRLA